MLKEMKLYYEVGEISVHIIRSNRKSMGLEIKSDLTVNARVPYRIDDKRIAEFILDKRNWVLDKYQELKTAMSDGKVPEDVYRDNSKLPLGSSFLQLNLVKARDDEHAAIRQKYSPDGHVILRIETMSEDKEFIRDCVADWYKKYARSVFHVKARQYAEIMNVNYKRIAVKEQKTRWGSCSSKENLNFNWKLVMMPEKVLDYVVVHELAHLKQMNHSRAFWSEVEKVLPDYRERKKWLDLHGKEYQIY